MPEHTIHTTLPTRAPLTQLAGRPLESLLEAYRDFLWKDYQPFIEAHVYDGQYGGFMCHTDYTGTQLNTHKRTWFDGRGVWVYAYMYQHLMRDPKYLDMAGKTLSLLEKAKPAGQRLWPWTYRREGLTLEEPGDIYGNLFVAEGMAEYAQASGNPAYLQKARGLLLDAALLYESPAYRYTLLYTPDAGLPVAGRVLGHSMIMLRVCTGMLRQQEDPEVEALADRCVRALMDKFYNREFHLMNEVLSRDYSLTKDAFAQFVYIGHAIEALWMIMDEALRREDMRLFDQAAGRFKRHVEVAWDDVYGGVFHCIDHLQDNKWLLDKVLWAQEEVLTGLMLLIRHKKDPWAIGWFDRMYRYVTEKFTLFDRGYPIWKLGGNRQVDFPGKGSRIENYHHPRHLMLNILALQALIEENKQAWVKTKNNSNH